MWDSVPWKPLLLAYASLEVAFFVVYTFHLVPRANRRTRPHDYRDYHERHVLLHRILDRMERTCQATNHSMVYFVESFLMEWFQTHPSKSRHSNSNSAPPSLQRLSSMRYHSTVSSSSSSSSPEVSSDEEDELEKEHAVGSLRKEDIDELFAWAFFAKHLQELELWEMRELELMYKIIQDRCGLVFEPGRTANKTPRLLNLEDMSSCLHRPLLVYALVQIFNVMGGMLLRWNGFHRHVTTNGLVYWHFPAKRQEKGKNRLPLLFFHGIAPGGLRPYLPMVLWGFGTRGRHVFLFENPPISCSMSFSALSEMETVAGVTEALASHLNDSRAEIALCGHSFGSCQLTWLLQSPLRDRIRQFVLIDPVTILLSEPDVMVNFLYSRQMEPRPVEGSPWTRFVTWVRRTKIQVVASSELFTEHYLRRHFSWYNSELWLEDIPSHVQVLVCLAELDEIIHAAKVRKEIELHNARITATHPSLVQVQLLHWEGVGHAHCVTSSRSWQQLAEHMNGQEESLTKKEL